MPFFSSLCSSAHALLLFASLLASGWKRGISVIGHRKYFPIPGYEDVGTSYVNLFFTTLLFAAPQWGFYYAATLFCRYPEYLRKDLVDGVEMLVCGR
jgi:hypothetical protein